MKEVEVIFLVICIYIDLYNIYFFERSFFIWGILLELIM